MHVEDKERFVAGSRVFDVEQGRVDPVEPVIGVRVEVSGNSNGLRSGAGGTNGVDRSLDRGRPECQRCSWFKSRLDSDGSGGLERGHPAWLDVAV